MDPKARSPRISQLSWGRLETEDGRSFKDAKLFPGGARAWDWRKTGTHHVPGIQPADVAELIEHGAEAVVLTMGVWKRLQVCPETLQTLRERGGSPRTCCRPRRRCGSITNCARRRPSAASSTPPAEPPHPPFRGGMMARRSLSARVRTRRSAVGTDSPLRITR